MLDLWRFANAMRRHTLLSPEATTWVFSRKPDPAGGGYGSFYHTVNGVDIAGMNGGGAGINAWLDIYLNGGYTLAVMSNYDPPTAIDIAREARRLLTGA